MPSLLYYNPNVVTHERHHAFPGLRRFSKFFSIYNPTVVFIDRTGTIRSPIKTRSLFPIPKMRSFEKSFEQICDERAKELLERSDELDVPIYAMWSGGIDSTLVLVSFLKRANPAQRARIRVLLSEDSLRENPAFFEAHISGKLATDSSILFPYILGTDALFVSGEHNDQLFGSDIIAKVIATFGAPFIHESYDREQVFKFFDERLQDAGTTNFYLDTFERLMRASPVRIATHYQYFWWINFSLKWQSVHLRTLSYTGARHAPKITRDYLAKFYAPFYCTEDFQLWSLWNQDKKIRDTWNTYKWICKDIIFDYTKDADYRDNKLKKGSLFSLAVQQVSYNFIDETMGFHTELDPEQYIQADNDFA
jgi:hypothetical protein